MTLAFLLVVFQYFLNHNINKVLVDCPSQLSHHTASRTTLSKINFNDFHYMVHVRTLVVFLDSHLSLICWDRCFLILT